MNKIEKAHHLEKLKKNEEREEEMIRIKNIYFVNSPKRNQVISFKFIFRRGEKKSYIIREAAMIASQIG